MSSADYDRIDRSAEHLEDLLHISASHIHRRFAGYVEREDLIQELRSCTELPIVFGGGISSLNDVRDLARHGADGIQIGTALHKGLLTISQCKRELATNGFDVREIAGT